MLPIPPDHSRLVAIAESLAQTDQRLERVEIPHHVHRWAVNLRAPGKPNVKPPPASRVVRGESSDKDSESEMLGSWGRVKPSVPMVIDAGIMNHDCGRQCSAIRDSENTVEWTICAEFVE